MSVMRACYRVEFESTNPKTSRIAARSISGMNGNIQSRKSDYRSPSKIGESRIFNRFSLETSRLWICENHPRSPPSRTLSIVVTIGFLWKMVGCVFRANPVTDSIAKLPPIPRQGCHPTERPTQDAGRPDERTYLAWQVARRGTPVPVRCPRRPRGAGDASGAEVGRVGVKGG